MNAFDYVIILTCNVTEPSENEGEYSNVQIISLAWSLFDLKANKNLTSQYKHVGTEDSGSSEALDVSDQNIQPYILQFENFVESEIHSKGKTMCLLTYGQYPLRQYIHPEAAKEKIDLPEYLFTFFDLRKEFTKRYKIDENLDDLNFLAKYCGCDTPILQTHDFQCAQECDVIAAIVQHMIHDGHVFSTPETINLKFDPGTSTGIIEEDTVIRARGLPWQSSDQDVANFFKGLNVVRGGVALCLNSKGRRSGEAFVRFENNEHRDMALKRHKHYLGDRYIEVYKATPQDFLRIARGPIGVTNDVATFLLNSKKAEVIVRMRGLPFSTKTIDVLEFFGEDAPVFQEEQGILFVKFPDGRATGDAFVLFEQEEEGQVALKKHRQVIGTRYVELFRSTENEVKQVLCRYSKFGPPGSPGALVSTGMNSPVPQSPYPSQSSYCPSPTPITTQQDCLRLRGLPYSAKVQDILDFLKEHGAYVVDGGVHMIFNAQARPSGEALVQTWSPEHAGKAASELHMKHMGDRYIEVYQCSAADVIMRLISGSYSARYPYFTPYNTNTTANSFTHSRYTQFNNNNYLNFNGYGTSSTVSSTVNGTSMTNGAGGSSWRGQTSPVPQYPLYNYHHSSNGYEYTPNSCVGYNSSYSQLRIRSYPSSPYEMMPLFQGYQVPDYITPLNREHASMV